MLLHKTLFAQGRMVINEYMPWPSNTCGTTSEFVELLNFGPGPVDLGCYIITNGTYAITIPPRTIVQPGQFFVLAGQDILPRNCGNIDSAVHVNLNWNTCNCTNVRIPTTGDGFMKDGGGSNVNLVLMDPSKKIIDGVTRATPTDASVPITTSGVAGGCAPQSFDLNTMTINYETLGMSTGSSNSFARQLDGDCQWVKQPKISANATNNTGSSGTASLTYNMNIVRSMDMCDGRGGAISIDVQGTNVASYFPMNYTLAFDANNDGVFNFADTYTYGADSSAPDIDISNLASGLYTVTVSSSKGCNLKSFVFKILACQSVLDLKLLYFKLAESTGGTHTFEWKLTAADDLHTTFLESSTDGINFFPEKEIINYSTGAQVFRQKITSIQDRHIYRLRFVNFEGKTIYSPIINTKNNFQLNSFGPNPASDKLVVDVNASENTFVQYRIVNINGTSVQQKQVPLHEGKNSVSINVQQLAPGIYQLVMGAPNAKTQPFSMRFVKQ